MPAYLWVNVPTAFKHSSVCSCVPGNICRTPCGNEIILLVSRYSDLKSFKGGLISFQFVGRACSIAYTTTLRACCTPTYVTLWTYPTPAAWTASCGRCCNRNLRFTFFSSEVSKGVFFAIPCVLVPRCTCCVLPVCLCSPCLRMLLELNLCVFLGFLRVSVSYTYRACVCVFGCLYICSCFWATINFVCVFGCPYHLCVSCFWMSV